MKGFISINMNCFSSKNALRVWNEGQVAYNYQRIKCGKMSSGLPHDERKYQFKKDV